MGYIGIIGDLLGLYRDNGKRKWKLLYSAARFEAVLGFGAAGIRVYSFIF